MFAEVNVALVQVLVSVLTVLALIRLVQAVRNHEGTFQTTAAGWAAARQARAVRVARFMAETRRRHA